MEEEPPAARWPRLLPRLVGAELGAPPVRSLPEFAALSPRGFAELNVAHSRAPAVLLELHALCATHDAQGARQALLRLSTACEFTSEGPGREAPDAVAAQRGIVLTGGWHTLVRLLAPEWDAAGDGGTLQTHTMLEVRAEALAVLRELTFAVPSFADTLAANDALPPRLFELCAEPGTFATASALLEEVSTARRTTLRIAQLPRFAEMLRGLGTMQLAVFCRVLALLVYANEARARFLTTLGRKGQGRH
jgi:hypothetical protein